jgi:hypothetical protein
MDPIFPADTFFEWKIISVYIIQAYTWGIASLRQTTDSTLGPGCIAKRDTKKIFAPLKVHFNILIDAYRKWI